MKLTLALALLGGTGSARGDSPQLDSSTPNDFYAANRPPLLPSPLIKLPIGAIEPRGWLRRQLELEAAGFVGHLGEISPFLSKKNNAWLSPTGEGEHGWEEVPYWLRGFGDLGYVLGDKRIISEAREWIEAVLAGQREDGYFGPRANLTHLEGKPDLWPNMVMLNALQSFHEFTGDARVLHLMTGYFRWQLQLPEEDFLLPFWQQQRAADNLASVYWLYNRTGRPWLLELAQKIHRRTADWTHSVANWHGVNIAQAFRGPAIYYQQSHDPIHYQATWQRYNEVMGVYGQVPGGGFGADENCRPGFFDPRQGTETCTWAELMHSFEMLLKIDGNAEWADRCEEIAFNSLPASMTADLKALHYLTSPNLVRCDRRSKSPGVENAGDMFSFNPRQYRCCQHNVGFAWPCFAEHLWLATPGNGLAAAMYAPCVVKARVGDGTEMTVVEDTHYPFEEQVHLSMQMPKPVRFPLHLRIPAWCRPEVRVNGEPVSYQPQPSGFAVLERQWSDGDRVDIHLPMFVRVRTWHRNQGSVSIDRGPLTFALRIQEKWEKYEDDPDWPAYELHPASAWNYGLVQDALAAVEVVQRPWPPSDQPFTPEDTPIVLKAQARRIPAWKEDWMGLAGPLQPSPARTGEPIETVELIPMGAARLRISSFPLAADSADAHEWQPLPQPLEPIPASASHVWQIDTVAALSDGLVPSSSNDQTIPRFTWWDRRGTSEWVQYDFGQPRQVAGVEVYWFDDRPTGGCRVPAHWRILYRDKEQWRPVENCSDCTIHRNQFNIVTFDPIETAALRLEVQLQAGYSAGILEWRVR